MTEAGLRDFIHELDHMTPAAAHVKLGLTLQDMIAGHNDLLAKHNALCAHLDAANLAGVGNANVATYGSTLTPIATLGTR